MFKQTDHRPWPLPLGFWIMTQSWEKLLFAHWPIDPNMIRSSVPDSLEIDTFEDQAWITIVPFQMNRIRFRLLPPVPGANSFPELNVRTYVTHQGKSGVYFLNIGANHSFAVWAAKKFAYLPYSFADIDWQEQDQQIHFACHRHKKLSFEADYQPISSAETPQVGTLEHWLLERYCMYTTHNKDLYRCEIHHQPWAIQQAEVNIIHNSIFDFHQLLIKKTNPLFHYVDKLKIWAWPLAKCSR